jgi:sulfur carrier protein ThiS adenylyltransferase
MFVETILSQLPNIPLTSGSGMAGFGSANSIKTRHVLKNFYLSGDGVSDVATEGALASPRVGTCAAHEATMVLRLILGETEP